MTAIGIAIFSITAAILLVEFLRHRKRALPLRGWLGLGALLAAEYLMFQGVQPVATYFTPIAWTCYIFLADAMLFAVAGKSRMSEPAARRELILITVLSVPLWVIFEIYNLKLENWTYVGLPENFAARYFGYIWSFATITPGIFITADLMQAFGWFSKPAKPAKFSPAALHSMMVAGALMLVLPALLPREIAAYLFAPVWLGFIFLLEPVNHRLRLPSLLTDLTEGKRARIYTLLLSGLACGFFWEFWNFWATAKWLYIFPMFQQWKIFEMPAPGYLGFPPFALECFSMYVTAAWLLGKLWPGLGIQPVTRAARGKA